MVLAARNRVGVAIALLGSLGMFASGPTPAYASTIAPTVTLTGQLIQLADQTGPALAAVRTADKQLVPVAASVVKHLKAGSAVTLNVVVPAAVRTVAAANRTLTVRGPNGRTTSTPLDAQDLAAASDGTPEPATSDLGRATAASAVSTGQALAVSAVVSAADPVGSFAPATRHLFVAIVTPKDWPTPNAVTPAQIQTQVAGASSYWSTVSGGAVTLDIATMAPPYRSSYNCADPNGMLNEAISQTGFKFDANTSVVVELPPDIKGCSYGLGTIGANVNGWGALYVSDDVFPVLAHELGHNMSLEHADTLLCPSSSDSAYDNVSGWTGSGCTEASYGDGDDVMSASARTFAPFLSSPQSLRTGLIPNSARTVISSDGTTSVVLNALGGLSGTRAAEIVDPTNGVAYYVEYRVATAPDTANVYGDAVGVRVLRLNPVDGTTVLLDPTPTGTSSDVDATLRVGGAFTSYSGAIQVTTISTTSATATISITRDITAPHAPSGVTATAGNTQAALSWTAPASNGGSQVTGYTVTAAPGGRTATTTGATTATVTGLTNGTAYTFTVTATNAVGTSPASLASAAVTPAAVPGSPTAVTATAGDAQAVVSWSAPASNGGSQVTGYTVTAAPGGRTATTTGATTATATVTGLTNGTAYTFTVTATNAVGTSPASAPSGAVIPVSMVQRYIVRVYSDLFNRAPDPGGLAAWTSALNAGTPRVAVANAITSSAEYRSKLITGSYAHYLGRTPDPGGLASWLAAMGRGMTIEQMQSGFIASPEYYAKAGSTDAGWVTKLYADVLNRPAAPSEVAGWTSALSRGMRRDQVAMGFLLSTEHLTTVVNGYYVDLLGRGIDPSGQRTWVGILQAGGRDEAIIGGIIASAEYYGRV